jgi:tetratricopeptide (TPR) repeat protein
LRLKESEDYRWEIFFSAARSHRLAGDVERAIDILQRLAADERNAAGTGWWIAKWYSEDGDYEKAAQYLRRELEQRFSPPESWQLSSIIALGAIASERDEASSFSKNLAEKAPNLYLVMCGLIQEHWPLFTRLSTESQSHWLYAAAQVHADCPLPEVRPAYLNSAVREYGWVLEHELKTGVFESFRKDVAADPRLREHLREDYNQDSKEPFLRFLQKKPEIGLGAMIKALEQCRHSSVKTEKNFCRWLDDRFPRIQTGVTAMGDVNRQRDRATHGNAGFDAASVRQVSSKCREALAALFGCGN